MMKRTGRILLAVALLAAGCRRSHAQSILLLGKDTRDKVLAQFFAQNGNAVAIIVGLNANFGTNRLNSDMIENALRGNSGARVLDGRFSATNSFAVQVWDTNTSTFQAFDFTLRTNLPVTTNVVSRIGMPEQLEYKLLDNFRLASNNIPLSGIVWLNGSSYGGSIAGKTGTNRLLVLDNYALGTSTTNWVDVTQGIVTEIR